LLSSWRVTRGFTNFAALSPISSDPLVAGVLPFDAGARKKSDRSETVLVRDPDIARNPNLQAARAECTGGKVLVTEEATGYDLSCTTKELSTKAKARSQTASKSDWAKIETAFRQ
jgi:hypothetical protein